MSPGGEVHLLQQLAKLHGVMRCLFAGLNHDGVAGDERRAGFSCDEKEWEIPGQDSADYSDGPSKEEDRFTGTIAFDDFALDPTAPFRHVIQVIGGEINFYARQTQCLALLLGDDMGYRLYILADLCGKRLEQFRADSSGLFLPGMLRCFCSRDGRRYVLFAAVGNCTDDVARRRIFHFDTVSA